MARRSDEEKLFEMILGYMLFTCKDIPGVKRKVTRLHKQIDEMGNLYIRRIINGMLPDELLKYEKNHKIL